LPEERLKQLSKDWEAGRFKPVYLFEGPDEYRRRRALDSLKRALLGEAAVETAFENLGATSARDLCERARIAPFFVEKRILTAEGVEDWTEGDLAAFEGYARDPSPSAVIVLTGGAKLDKRKKAYKLFDKLDAVYIFGYVTGASRRARIAAEAKRLELKLADDALAFLERALAPDLYTVVREIEKLAIYADGRELGAAECERVAATTHNESAYDMVRHVAEGKAAEALAAIERLLASGERPESLVGLLARQIRLIWLAKEFGAAGLSRGEIAARLGVAPYFVGEYVGAAARLSEDKLARLHSLLSELDVNVKTGKMPGALALEVFAAQAAA
jgi:DNA polymerase-3 subunit delta